MLQPSGNCVGKLVDARPSVCIVADWKVFDAGSQIGTFPTKQAARIFAIAEAELFEVDLLIVQFVHAGQAIPAGAGFTCLITAKPESEGLEAWKYLDRQSEQCRLARVKTDRSAK